MSIWPEVAVETPLGRMRAWATSEGHIGIATLSPDEARHDGWAGVATSITVNRVEHRLRMDITTNSSTEGGRWGVEEVAPGWFMGYHDLYLKRADRLLGDDASDAARRKVKEIMVPWLAEFVTESVLGKALLEQAGGKRREDRLKAIEAKLAALEAERMDLIHEKAALQEVTV